MNLSEINPFVRYSEKRKYLLPYKDFVMPYDHRIFYVHNGKIRADVSGSEYEIKSNQMLIIPPAVKYKLTFSEDVLSTILNFDILTEDTVSAAIEPMIEERFDYSRILSDVTCDEFPCLLSCDENAHRLISEISEVFNSNSKFRNEIISSLLKLLIIKSFVYSSSEKCPALVTDIIEYIDENYAHDISNKTLGEIFSYHPNYINRVFRENAGQSLHSYVLNVRLEKAAALIRESQISLSEAAQRCGFCTQAYFTKKFKEKYRTTPYKFKNKKYL